MTNYKREAGRSFEALHDWQAEEGMTDASMITVAIEAQTNATLYLAEQQRIANLIAVATAESDLLKALPESSPFATVFTQIREGLALS